MTRSDVASGNGPVAADGGFGRAGTVGAERSRVGRRAFFEDRNTLERSRPVAGAMKMDRAMAGWVRWWAAERKDGCMRTRHSVKTDVVAVAWHPWPFGAPLSLENQTRGLAGRRDSLARWWRGRARAGRASMKWTATTARCREPGTFGSGYEAPGWTVEDGGGGF